MEVYGEILQEKIMKKDGVGKRTRKKRERRDEGERERKRKKRRN